MSPEGMVSRHFAESMDKPLPPKHASGIA